MTESISKLTQGLKELGEIQVNNWDIAGLMNKNIGDLEIGSSIRRLGQVKVMDWDFSEVLPAVSKLAQKEVDLGEVLRKTAGYKVMEWEFGSGSEKRVSEGVAAGSPPVEEVVFTQKDLRELMGRLKKFMEYLCSVLLESAHHANVEVKEIKPKVLQVRVILVAKDVAMLIGREGHSASAIRSLLKAATSVHGVHALLEIISHEDHASRGR